MIEVFSADLFNLNESEIDALYSIIIECYASTEYPMWGENYIRIPKTDFLRFIENNEILVARYNGEIAGGLRYYPISTNTYSFGLFGVDFNWSRKGIGKALINKVEELVRQKGWQRIQIEILKPRGFEIPIKTMLHDWYQSLGYTFLQTKKFEEVVPEKAKEVLVSCDFDYYTKKIL
jgi:GNAT superfamily N-acetyltransferase